MAGAFLKILNQWPEVRLGPPQAEFTHTSYKSRTEALRGYWLVCWPRIDDEGHPFYWDHVTISLPENYEPSGACVMLGTPYVQPQGKPLSQKEALTKAKEAAWWKDSEPYSVADKLIGARLYAARLVIVAPQKRHWWQIFLDTTNSRLAWECWFEPIHSEKLKGPWYDERYAVRIDAYTGAVIGGDAML